MNFDKPSPKCGRYVVLTLVINVFRRQAVETEAGSKGSAASAQRLSRGVASATPMAVDGGGGAAGVIGRLVVRRRVAFHPLLVELLVGVGKHGLPGAAHEVQQEMQVVHR